MASTMSLPASNTLARPAGDRSHIGRITVIGLVFAESTTYEDIGYSLTMPAVAAGLQQALQHNQPTGTGSCTD